jgi:hypothetical protein
MKVDVQIPVVNHKSMDNHLGNENLNGRKV